MTNILLVWAAMAGWASPQAPYWQQRVHYLIQASIDDTTGLIDGRQQITYQNRSPDTLSQFYLHLHLNAFRPGSRWSRRDSIHENRRFNDLADPDFGFQRLRAVRVGGVLVAAEFPYAPDSTVVRLSLPRPLTPGDSLAMEMEWTARPSTVPRRQGRRGRHLDLAHWYPRVAVYDIHGWQDRPLYPQGEFYGEFGTYDVRLTVASDQVVAATGVVLEGDPGWQGASEADGMVDLQRDWYSEVPDRNRCDGVVPTPDTKCLRLYARDVHHFALSLDPAFRYQEGSYRNAVIRVFFWGHERNEWGRGQMVARVARAMDWLNRLFGPYPWPQLTVARRLDGGATEFPMMFMSAGASEGLVVHEVGHNYLMGVLANNEWKEAFLDEGFSNFQGTWYREVTSDDYQSFYATESIVLPLDLDGWSQPVSLPSELYRDPTTYQRMVYTKGELFFHALRYLVGSETMVNILREYYSRWRLKHVSERKLLETAETVSKMELSWFFAEALHSTPLYDYAIGSVERTELPEGGWETRVEVVRKGEGRMPVEVGLAERATAVRLFGRSDPLADRDTVTFRTPERPGRLMLDPLVRIRDWNFTNNYEGGVFRLGGTDWRLDRFVTQRVRRDAQVVEVAPTFWYNDAAEITVGVRFRSNYLGRFNRYQLSLQRGTTGSDPATLGESVDFHLKLENPVALHRPMTGFLLEGWAREGTVGARVRQESERRESWLDRNHWKLGWLGQWVATSETAFLDSRRWENAGTVEFGGYLVRHREGAGTELDLRWSYLGGVAYSRQDIGLRLEDQFESELFGRGSFTAVYERSVGSHLFRSRLYLAGYLAPSDPLKQRAVYLAGADPYQTLGNPFVRSQGALLVRPDFFYHSPGGGNLRGYDPSLAGRWILATNLEWSIPIFEPAAGILRRVAGIAFGDLGLVDERALGSLANAAKGVYDAGVGLRAQLGVGDLEFPLRVEFPLWVSDPEFAHDTQQGTDRFEFRWLVSLQPSF